MVLNIFYAICLTLFFIKSANTSASSEPEVLSISAERTRKQRGNESVLFLLENKSDPLKRRAILTINSNFLESPKEVIRLGTFETNDVRGLEAERRLLINWSKGVGRETQEFADIHRTPRGQTHVFVGGFRLDPFSPVRSDALAFLERVHELSVWRATDAIEIRKKPGNSEVVVRYLGAKNFREKKTTKELDCLLGKPNRSEKTKAEEELLCFFGRYGTAWLPK